MPDGLRVAQKIEQHGLWIIVGDQIQTVLGWLSRLPGPVRLARPCLGIPYALTLLFTGDVEGAEARLREAEGSL